MVKVRLDDWEHWAKRAEEMRVIADNFEYPDCREILLGMADDYDHFAEIAGRRVLTHSGLLAFSQLRLYLLR